MDIKVKFFEDRFVEAIGPGIYGIYFQTNAENKELLYVGESVFVLVRCAAHLYEIVKGDGYLGFTKEIIKDRHPKMQSEISDRVKSIEDMIKEMTNLLNNTAPI